MILAIHGASGYEGRSLFDATKILSRHGYQVQLTDTISCPDSFTQCINPPPTKEQLHIYTEVNAKIALLVKRESPWLITLFFISAWIISELILFYLADVALFILELIPGVRKLLSFSYTKSFRRYIEPHFKPSNKNTNVC